MKKRKKKIIATIIILLIVLIKWLHWYICHYYEGNPNQFLCVEMKRYYENKNVDSFIFFEVHTAETIDVRVDKRSFELKGCEEHIEANDMGYHIQGTNCYYYRRVSSEYQFSMYEEKMEHTISIERRSSEFSLSGFSLEMRLYSDNADRDDLNSVKKQVSIQNNDIQSFYADMTKDKVTCRSNEDLAEWEGTLIRIRPEKKNEYTEYRISDPEIVIHSFEIRFAEDGSGGVYLDMDGDGIYEYAVEGYVAENKYKWYY